MALIFIEGFEGYGTTAGTNFDTDFFNGKWVTENGNNTQIGEGRNEGQSLRCHSATLGAVRNFGTMDAEFILGFNFRYTALANICVMAAFRLTGNVRTNLLLNTNGTISVRRSTTTLATGTTELQPDTWYQIELKTKCRDGIGNGSYELKINGVVELSAAADMVASGVDGANEIRFAANTGNTLEYDDMYLLDTSGTLNNDYLGETKVELLYPDGAGSQTGWTPNAGSNFSQVDETAGPDGDTSYVETSSASAEDLYTFGSLAGSGTIHGVQVDSHAIGASSSFALLARSGSTTGAGSTKSTTASYSYYGSVFQTNPDTSSAWAAAEVNGAEFGIRRVSGTPRVTRLAVAVLRATVSPIEGNGTSTVTLGDEAHCNLSAPQASSSLGLAHSTDASIVALAAVSTLALSQESSVPIINLTAASILVLDQDVVETLMSGHAASVLSLTDSARGPFAVLSEDTLAAIQAVVVQLVLNRSLTDTLTLTSQSLASKALTYLAESGLTITDEVQQIIAKKAESLLTLVDEALRSNDGESTLVLEQLASVPWGAVSTLQFTSVAAFVPPSATRFSLSDLNISQQAIVNKTLNLFPVSTLVLDHGLALINPPSHCVWPDLEPPIGSLQQGLRLIGDTTVLISRSMNLGDINRLAFDRISRETRGGTLKVFADPNWPKTETLVFTVSAVKRTKAHEVLAFLLAHLGRDITLETHEGRQWLGFVLNPSEAVIEDHPNSFTISIEFEGELQTA